MQLTDQFNRKINYIRISVTDRCDFRCIYCMSEQMKFLPKKELLSLKKEDWVNLSEEKFDEIFEESAVKRTGFKGLKRNIEFVKKSDQTLPE